MHASSQAALAGRVVAVSVGLPREVQWGKRRVLTGIYKSPVDGPVVARASGLEGDGQADPRVHGGRFKAVYGYPSEHYGAWARELARGDLGWGAFGENLTTEGLLEATVHLGDRFEVGAAVLEVTQPRVPCFKLGNKFGTMDFVKQFAKAGRSGFYFAVVREGAVEAGAPITRLHHARGNPTVAQQFALFLGAAEEDGEDPR